MLTRRDVAAGYPLPAATSRRSASDQHSPAASARQGSRALAALLDDLTALARTGRRLSVSFSGGRDSSLVLAAATAVARAEGTALPVPITQVWPHRAELDESRWQELIVTHLGLPDWQRIDMGDDADLLGEVARSGLREVGLTWPPTIHSKTSLWRAATGTHLITGEGGDQVFGPTRVRALHHWRRAVRAPRSWARPTARALAPTPLLRLRALGHPTQHRPWLRPAFAEQVADAWRRHEATEPWSAARGIGWMAEDRAVTMGLATLAEHAQRHEVHLHHPLLAPPFLDALAADAGLLGWPDRTRAMAAVAGDLVPSALTARTDKIDFVTTIWGEATMSWLARWDGASGVDADLMDTDLVDADLVDADALREEWSRPAPHPATAMLAQAAWLAQEGVDLRHLEARASTEVDDHATAR